MALENGKVILCVFIDLRRAFETVNREILLQKLRLYGVGEDALRWFASYLSNRKQQTKVQDDFSGCAGCDTGVPQGSILSCLLFILYVNDVTKILKHCKLKMFADDKMNER